MSVTPNRGSCSGGTPVVLTGTNLLNPISVKFGNTPGTVTANTSTSIHVTSPAGTGVVDVCVVTSGGTSNYEPFYYIEPPIISSLSTTAGPIEGGNTIYIRGYNLLTASTVYFGALTAVPVAIDDSQIWVQAPLSEVEAGVSVYVVTAGGTSGSLNYAFVNIPTATAVSPNYGPTTGGTIVTITGENLSTTSNVTFNDITTAFSVLSNNILVAIAPPGEAGVVDIVVTTAGGAAEMEEVYTYQSAPGI